MTTENFNQTNTSSTTKPLTTKNSAYHQHGSHQPGSYQHGPTAFNQPDDYGTSCACTVQIPALSDFNPLIKANATATLHHVINLHAASKAGLTKLKAALAAKCDLFDAWAAQNNPGSQPPFNSEVFHQEFTEVEGLIDINNISHHTTIAALEQHKHEVKHTAQ